MENCRDFKCNHISLNVKGIREKGKRQRICAWCKEKKADIVFLQETFSSRDVEDKWASEWNGQGIYSHGTSHSKGVLMLINASLDIEIKKVICDSEGRYILVDCILEGVRVILCNVYFPVRNKEKEQTQLLKKIQEELGELNKDRHSIIIGGDFNMVRNEELDYFGNNKPSSQSRFNLEMENFMETWNLVDIWRQRNLMKKQFTYRQKVPFMQSRLDYWIISEDLADFVVKCEIMTSVAPDHSAIYLSFFDRTENLIRNKGSYWKFNNSLCNDPVYVQQMKEEILKLKRDLQVEIQDKRVLWDFLKLKIRQFTQLFSKKLSKYRKEQREKLEKEVKELEDSLIDQPDQEACKILEGKKRELQASYDYINEGVKIRSRASWYEGGERDVRYFTQLMQSNQKKSTIKKLLNEKGEIICNEGDIMIEIKSFYNKLYAKSEVIQNSDIQFFPVDLPKLSKDSKESCEGLIVERECLQVLEKMKLNKSPGNDGLTVEFYRTFWPVIGQVVVEALNEAFLHGELSASQKQAMIILIAKEGKDLLQIKNYRPISLLNVDYKILSKVLALRITKVLNEVILEDQLGFMKGRNIGEAIRIIDDMIFHTSHFDLPGFLVAIDFEKAFDSVAHSFVQEVLSFFGFGPSFRKWVDILYNNALSCVFNGGKSTGYFKIEKGVRQGDPLSPYLFILCIEILAHSIRKDTQVLGLPFGEKEVKQVLYADDITLFVQDIVSIRRLEFIFECFRQVSGLKINMDKTKVLLLGCSHDSNYDFPFGQKVDVLKILGVFFTLDVDVKEKLNYKEILSKIKKLLTWWKQRDLTLIGKNQLLKTFIYSKLIYVASLTPVPAWIYEELENIVWDFIWRGRPKIKKSTLLLDYEQGGLKFMHFPSLINAQRVIWVKRLFQAKEEMKWKQYFEVSTKHIGGKFIFSCNYLTVLLNVSLPEFYIDLLETWAKTKEFRGNYEYLGKEVFFNNKMIRIEGKCIYNEKLFLKQMFRLEHILDRNGELNSVAFFYSKGLDYLDVLQIKKNL